jgi:4-amino-4-deoxy-L-arabinose transferase-like glycosyltransferase
MSPELRNRIAIFMIIFLLAFSVRLLTMQFMKMHLHDAAWFQIGSYQMFEGRAENILSGRERLFWIDDPSRTDLVQYPPAFPWWIALIYRVTGNHSVYAVQRVQWILDLLLSMFLITGIAFTAFGWRAAMAASFLSAVSPLLAMYGAWPSSDALTSSLVLAATWMLLLAAKTAKIKWAIGAGLLLGAACWLRVNPLFLNLTWAFGLLLLLPTSWKERLRFSFALAVSSLLLVAPITLRNAIVFHEFLPNGLNVGVNLWEGLGETERGVAAGMVVSDQLMLEIERKKLNLPPEYPLTLAYPDGIRRDRERMRESLQMISAHPFWYVGVMGRRAARLLKIAGKPAPYQASAGINVTSKKCLSPAWQGGVVAMLVDTLGMMQSVIRYLILFLLLPGVWLGIRRNRLGSSLLLITVFYYLLTCSVGHTEMRYALPMYGVLFVFAGVAVTQAIEAIKRRKPYSIFGAFARR